MPEPTPATPSTATPAQHSDAPTPPPPRPRLAGWVKVLFIIGIVAIALRLAMFLLLHYQAHHAPALPTWPLHAGDVLPLTPGDANIAKWAQDPSSTGFIVQLLDTHGNPLPTPTFCALEPDYMADAQQPGGTLTLVTLVAQAAQQPAGSWSVRWFGGNTVPPFLKGAAHFEANCGKTATILMSSEQLHAFLDILNGVSMFTPSAPALSQPQSK